MSVISLAVIGKSNEPLFMKEFLDADTETFSEQELFGLEPSSSAVSRETSCSLKQQFVLHAALDRFEQAAGPPPSHAWREPGAFGADAMFVGLLCPVEDMRVYGYMTTTNIKFLLVVEDRSILVDQRRVDQTIKQLFVQVHGLYVEYTLNPFHTINAPIKSPRFDSKVAHCINAYNASARQ